MGALLRWFVFSVGFGLLPFAFSVLLRLLHGEAAALVRNAPELLFLALMLSSIQMGEFLAGDAGRDGGAKVGSSLRGAGFCVFLIVAVLSAMLYGVHVQALRASDGRASGNWVTFESNLFSLGVVLAVVAVSLGTLAELTRTRRK